MPDMDSKIESVKLILRFAKKKGREPKIQIKTQDNVVIKNALIGNNVIISDNSSIGTSGFGFDLNKRGSPYLNPQIGIVIIEDNVNLGSCCTIDRGKIDFTLINSLIILKNWFTFSSLTLNAKMNNIDINKIFLVFVL